MNFPLVEYFTILSVFTIGAISPGPDFAMVLRQSVIHGRKEAIYTSLGISFALLVHGAYTILGLGIIISQSLILFTMLKYAGAAYLLWLGISAFLSKVPKAIDDEKSETPTSISPIKAFTIGFLTNLLNPKAMLFFVSLFTIIISFDTQVLHKVFYVISMSIILFLWFSLVSIFFTTQKMRNSFYKLGKWFNRITGLALIFLAIKVALTTTK